MMKMNIEKVRLGLALELTKTAHVVKNGLSVVDPKKLAVHHRRDLRRLSHHKKPDPATVYTEKFLPPLAERKL